MIRAVDWATDKADERERKGKNRTDPYIAACAQGIPFSIHLWISGDLPRPLKIIYKL